MGINYKTYSDNQLSFALRDVKKAMKLHPVNSSYYNKLLEEYDKIIGIMSDRCVKEYNNCILTYHKKYIQK